MCSLLRGSADFAGLAVAVVGQVQLLAHLLLLGGDELVELLAGGEPVLLLAEEDVVDRQPAGGRVAAARRGRAG